MNNPPNPGFPSATPAVISELLAEIVRYPYVVTSRDTITAVPLGLFDVGGIQTPMVIVGAGGSSVQWRIAAQSDLTPHLVSATAYDVLRGGSLNTDGSINYHGQNYQLRARWNGSQSIAEASLK